MTALDYVPDMTDPLGRHWRQPSREGILMDATNCMMSRESFRALHTYSSSFPTGTYSGKMWKAWRVDGWFLVFYGAIEGKDILIEYRRILNVPEDANANS